MTLTPELLIPRLRDKIEVDNETGCWLWTASVRKSGYGNAYCDTKKTADYAHRVVYAALKGAHSAGLELDHLCRVRRCVSPYHLEAVTHVENMRRSPLTMARASHCQQGHELNADNVYETADGGRTCKPCAKHRAARQNARRKADVHYRLAAVAAVDEIAALHAGGFGICGECGTPYPCETVQVIQRAYEEMAANALADEHHAGNVGGAM